MILLFIDDKKAKKQPIFPGKFEYLKKDLITQESHIGFRG